MPLLFEVFEQIESFNKFFRLFDRFSTLWFLANSIFQATFKFLVTSKFLSFLRNFEDPVVDPLQKWKTIRSLPQSKWKPAGLGGMFCPRTIWTNHIFHIWYIFFWCNVEVLLHHWQNNTSCAEESLFLPLRFGVGYCFCLKRNVFLLFTGVLCFSLNEILPSNWFENWLLTSLCHPPDRHYQLFNVPPSGDFSWSVVNVAVLLVTSAVTNALYAVPGKRCSSKKSWSLRQQTGLAAQSAKRPLRSLNLPFFGMDSDQIRWAVVGQ